MEMKTNVQIAVHHVILKTEPHAEFLPAFVWRFVSRRHSESTLRTFQTSASGHLPRDVPDIGSVGIDAGSNLMDGEPISELLAATSAYVMVSSLLLKRQPPASYLLSRRRALCGPQVLS